MSETEVVIEKLKSRFRVETDSDLASKLLVSRSTVANWRKRDTIPARYVRISEGETNWSAFSRPKIELSDIERAAMQLAILRLIRDFKDITTDYSAFLTRGTEAAYSFNLYWAKACTDISEEMSLRQSEEAMTIAQFLAYNEVFADK